MVIQYIHPHHHRQQDQRGFPQPPAPAIRIHHPHRIRRNRPPRRQRSRRPPHPPDLLLNRRHDRPQVPARRIPPLEPQQQTQVIHFQQVSRLRRIVPRERLLQFLKENFPGELMSKQLRLQRQPRPVRKYRIPRAQHRFIQKRHHPKNHLLHILRTASPAARILFRHPQRLPHLRPECFRILHRLPVVAQPHHRCEHFLKSQREVPPAPVHGRTRPSITSQWLNWRGSHLSSRAAQSSQLPATAIPPAHTRQHSS